MDVQFIKQLMKGGDFLQARELLEKRLAQTPSDEVAQMLYGTCCQIMGDTETFGCIYQRLAPKMQRCVERGEQSERAVMWVKCAAMFAMLLMCGTQLWAKDVDYATLGDDDDPTVTMSTNVKNDEFRRVLKMSPRDRMLYFLKRPEVSREFHKGNARAIFISLRGNEVGWFSRRADNLLLIRADSSLKTFSEVVKALNDAKDGEAEEGEVFVRFSPFWQIFDASSVERLVSSCEERVEWREESVREQEGRVREQEERVRAQEETMQSFKESSEERIRANKLLENEDRICKLEEQIRMVDDRIRKRNLEDELRSVTKRKEAIQSVMDHEKQKQSLEERRKEVLSPEEAAKLEKEIQSLYERVREIRKNNSIGRRRSSWPRQLLDLQARAKNLSEQIEWIKSESSNGLATCEELKAEREGLEAQRLQLLPKRRELASERRQLETHRTKLESERQKLESGRRRLESEREELAAARKNAQFEIECLRNGEMIPTRYKWKSLPDTLYAALQGLQGHGDVADLILASDETDCQVLGISDEVQRINSAYGTVSKMSPRDQMLYFLKRPEVSRELHKGDARASVIPLQLPRECEKQENLLLIRVKNSLTTGAEVVNVLKEAEESLVSFSSFEYAVNPNPADPAILDQIRSISDQIRRLKDELPKDGEVGDYNQIDRSGRARSRIFEVKRKMYEAKRKMYEDKRKMYEAKRKKLDLLLNGGEMIPSSSTFNEVLKDHSLESRALEVVFRTIEGRGDISNLVISSEEPGWLILGVCFVNVHGRMERTAYGGPRDYGDRFPKRVVTPQGKVIYVLTEEMVRKQEEEERKRWERPKEQFKPKYGGPRFRKPRPLALPAYGGPRFNEDVSDYDF